MAEYSRTVPDTWPFDCLNGASSSSQSSEEFLITPGPALAAAEYNMNHQRRGYALIFNHKYFKSGKGSRIGAEYDVKALEKAFERLGFTLLIRHDFTKAQIYKELDRVAQLDHANCDCIVVVAMSHGDKENLYAYDKKYPVSTLWKAFEGKKSLTLVAKPKLFFIQACRGEATDKGVRVGVTATDSLPNDYGPTTKKAYYIVPKSADILVANATNEDYFAYRNEVSGSWFIQELCKQLNADDGSLDILEILTQVNQKVATTKILYDPDNPKHDMKVQMSTFTSTLRHKLFFRPKSFVYGDLTGM